MEGTFVAYYRVSTDRQGRSGLGLEAQRSAVEDFLNGGRWHLVGEFTEVESGKRNSRPELLKAMALCRKRKAKLVIAKLDRLSRNVAFIAALMESKVEFVAVDNPHATKLTIHILSAVAEHEREMIAARTKAALQAAKRRGVRLGRNGAERLAPRYHAEAIERARRLEPTLHEMQGRELSARAMARELNEQGIAPVRGRLWYAVTVQRVIARLPRDATKRPIS
jgi:DNA invertase Pin-like site-specific DNA recombinase